MRTDKLNLAVKNVLGDGVKKVLIKFLFPWRNNFILFNVSNRAQNNRVNIDYWDESKNLGDTLSPIIVEYMLKQKGLSLKQNVNGKKHLYAVGSVLTAGIQDATVWGSGVLNAKLSYRLEKRKLDVRAVRGPVTRAILMDYGYEVPEVYGDPAILLPNIYIPEQKKKIYKFGLIIHKDYDLTKVSNSKLKKDMVKIINIKTDNFKQFVDELNSVEIVISSSLHGIILAEAYGISAVLLKPQVDIVKYVDYYYSTERLTYPVARTVEEAMETVPVRLPDLRKLQEKLMATFPYDLFKE